MLVNDQVTGPPGVAQDSQVAPHGGPQGGQWPWETPLPPQQRGRARRVQIVAATAELINTHGPVGEHLGVRAITRAEETSPASLYHYFPDVEAVITTVTTEYMQDLITATGEAFRAGHPTYEALQHHLVHIFWAYFAARPGLREMWFQRRASDTAVQIHEHYLASLAQQLHDAAAVFVQDPGQLLHYRMVLAMSGALWQLAFHLDPAGEREVVEEIHNNAWAFLRRHAFGAFPTDPAAPALGH